MRPLADSATALAVAIMQQTPGGTQGRMSHGPVDFSGRCRAGIRWAPARTPPHPFAKRREDGPPKLAKILAHARVAGAKALICFGRLRSREWPLFHSRANAACGHCGLHVISMRIGISFFTGMVSSDGGSILKSVSVVGIVPAIRLSLPSVTNSKATCL